MKITLILFFALLAGCGPSIPPADPEVQREFFMACLDKSMGGEDSVEQCETAAVRYAAKKAKR